LRRANARLLGRRAVRVWAKAEAIGADIVGRGRVAVARHTACKAAKTCGDTSLAGAGGPRRFTGGRVTDHSAGYHAALA
jgi:hypothetical protein